MRRVLGKCELKLLFQNAFLENMMPSLADSGISEIWGEKEVGGAGSEWQGGDEMKLGKEPKTRSWRGHVPV